MVNLGSGDWLRWGFRRHLPPAPKWPPSLVYGRNLNPQPLQLASNCRNSLFFLYFDHHRNGEGSSWSDVELIEEAFSRLPNDSSQRRLHGAIRLSLDYCPAPNGSRLSCERNGRRRKGRTPSATYDNGKRTNARLLTGERSSASSAVRQLLLRVIDPKNLARFGRNLGVRATPLGTWWKGSSRHFPHTVSKMGIEGLLASYEGIAKRPPPLGLGDPHRGSGINRRRRRRALWRVLARNENEQQQGVQGRH